MSHDALLICCGVCGPLHICSGFWNTILTYIPSIRNLYDAANSYAQHLLFVLFSTLVPLSMVCEVAFER